MTYPVRRLREHRELAIPALAGVLWADGRMAFPQVRALEVAAQVLGHDEIARVITRRGSRIDGAALTSLPEDVRPLLYAASSWVAQVDGRLHDTERAELDRLARLLGMKPELAGRLDALAARLVAVVGAAPAPGQLEALLLSAARFAELAEAA